MPPPKDEAEAKRLFAIALLREPKDSFKAACTVFFKDTNTALYVSEFWVNDPEVLAEQSRLIAEHGADFFLPSKEEALAELYLLTQKGEYKDRIAAMKLYLEARDFMPQKGAAVQIDARNQTVDNRVMVVNSHGSDDDWTKALREQQQRLISEARH